MSISGDFVDFTDGKWLYSMALTPGSINIGVTNTLTAITGDSTGDTTNDVVYSQTVDADGYASIVFLSTPTNTNIITFTEVPSTPIQFISVGGGGNASGTGAAGGGGGITNISDISSYLSSTLNNPIQIVIGKGGTGTASNQDGYKGTDTILGIYTSYGGGGGMNDNGKGGAGGNINSIYGGGGGAGGGSYNGNSFYTNIGGCNSDITNYGASSTSNGNGGNSFYPNGISFPVNSSLAVPIYCGPGGGGSNYVLQNGTTNFGYGGDITAGIYQNSVPPNNSSINGSTSMNCYGGGGGSEQISSSVGNRRYPTTEVQSVGGSGIIMLSWFD